jgi:hypothetical protein
MMAQKFNMALKHRKKLRQQIDRVRSATHKHDIKTMNLNRAESIGRVVKFKLQVRRAGVLSG